MIINLFSKPSISFNKRVLPKYLDCHSKYVTRLPIKLSQVDLKM